MNRMLSRVLGWLCLAGTFGWLMGPLPAPAELPVPVTVAPKSEVELLQRLQTAVEARDKAAILALYNWDGVADWTKKYQATEVDDWMTRELKSAKISPLPTNFVSSGTQGNVRFHMNVQPTAVIELHFTDGYGSGFPCGRKGDVYYLPGVVTDEQPAPLDESTNVVIRVQTPDGRPVVHVSVDASPPGGISILHSKRSLGGAYLTDAQGRFPFPSDKTNLSLAVANEDGFGYLRSDEVTNHAVMLVRPWGCIEGTLKNYGVAVSNVQLELSLNRDFYGSQEPPRVRLAGENSLTDAQGRFVFDAVPPAQLVINRHEPQEVFGIHVSRVTVNPGETNQLNLELHARTIAGRVVPAPGLAGDASLDLTQCSARLLPLAKNPDGLNRTIYFPVASNGMFHIELVEPGDYKFAGDLWGESNKVGVLDPVVVHVPAADSAAAAATPLDLGSVALVSAVKLKPGDPAPDFSVTDLEDKPLRLADYRGKYVLLDFWATWCGPCVAETPNMKATYEAYGKDSRFAMISLSLDSDQSAPRKFAQRLNIAWTQGFLGDWANDKVTATYGVYGIPSIFLIGPDGKVVATGLRGEKLKEAVGAALKN